MIVDLIAMVRLNLVHLSAVKSLKVSNRFIIERVMWTPLDTFLKSKALAFKHDVAFA